MSIMSTKVKAYKKENPCSYALGASITIELINTRPEIVREVNIHSAYRGKMDLTELCQRKNIPVSFSDKAFNIVSPKENCFVFGVVEKYIDAISPDKPHIVLVNPSDMGNLGTIIRTMAGMNYKNLAIIEPAADIWNPKTIRAAMGGLFHINFELFSDFSDYKAKFPDHALFPFMLKGTATPEDAPECDRFSLIFGNEAHGLDNTFLDAGQSIKIPFTPNVDSFNLAVAAGIGMYIFSRKNNLI